MTRASINNVATSSIGVDQIVENEDTEEKEEVPAEDEDDGQSSPNNAEPVEEAAADNDGTTAGTNDNEAANINVEGSHDEANNKATSDGGGGDDDDSDVASNADHNAKIGDNDHDKDEDDVEEKEELWDLKVVLSAEQIRMAHPVQCQTDGCELVACCIWSSTLDPETPWYSCLDCQEDHFGGWPSMEESGSLPIKVLGDDLREAMLEKCTDSDDPTMPDMPSSIGAERGNKATDDEGGSDRNETPINEEDEDEDDDGEVLWELKKVFSVKELTKSKPTRCKTDDCDLVACSVWKSSEGSWFSCLDCQEK